MRFLATAYGVTWALSIPVFTRRGQGAGSLAAAVVGSAEPTVAAVLQTRATPPPGRR